MQILNENLKISFLSILKNIRTNLIKGKNYSIFFLTIFALILFIASFSLGKFHIPIIDLLNIFYKKIFGLKQTWSETVNSVIFHIRMPRIIAAMLIGSVLAVSGTTFQSIFKNPLVAPDILGASAGAGFGAVLGIYFNLNLIYVQLIAFAFGMGAVAITYLIGKAVKRGMNMTLSLILAGVVISQLFQGLISLIQYLADPANMLQQAIVFWLMGGLSTLTMENIMVSFIPIIIGLTVIFLLRWRLNIISLGDEEAESLGLDSSSIRFILIFCTTLITSVAVAIGGIIGWVGIIIPNLTRIIFGANFKLLVPISILLGGSFLLIVDDVARTVFSVDVPIGIFTALLGGPIFAIVLLKALKN